ncbi:cystatin C (amyloid angiopathy and cerebral hemorrhage) [Phyllopteryx taeniolatus]|uniref:cystatin C (amyloid angiopathy and cerebral hemorrhage) n=1 Tax=Phyllopteryx taeniolatus TaxID=161469 RepID=UPI002AD246A9|nr:cystatin C (amyloid angiopathy and cerebral hemorrhage) [Phyllopteryx taeniolatus]
MILKVVFLLLGVVCAVVLGRLVGGLSDADPNSEDVQNALNFAIVQHNSASNDMFLSQKTEVVKVKKQLVSGTRYVITVNMAKTSCRKDGSDEHCDILQDPVLARPYQCTFTVWSRPWLTDLQLLEQKC